MTLLVLVWAVVLALAVCLVAWAVVCLVGGKLSASSMSELDIDCSTIAEGNYYGTALQFWIASYYCYWLW